MAAFVLLEKRKDFCLYNQHVDDMKVVHPVFNP
jgi:hypothetical protein